MNSTAVGYLRFVAMGLLLAISVRSSIALDIYVRPATEMMGKSLVTLQLRPSGAESNRPPLRIKCTVGESVSVDVPVGEYFLELDTHGFWSPSRTVRVSDANELITVSVRPTGTVRGGVTAVDHAVVDQVRLRFQSLNDESLSGEATCPVDHGVVACELPAGPLDLRFGVPGYAGEFRWDVRVQASQTVHVGLLRFTPGASIVGWVRESGERNSLREARVVLNPVTVPQSEKPMLTTPNERGFFSFRGLAPGDYWLSVRMKDAASEEIRVAVRPRAEAAINTPILISQPRTFRVRVSPFLDLNLQRWQIRLFRIRTGERRLVSESRAAEDGTWEIHRLPPGTYEAVVAGISDGQFALQRAEVRDQDVDLVVTIDLIPVEGKVTLGHRPLSGAHVIFGGEKNAISISFHTDESGKFHGAIPLRKDGAWQVTVASETPLVKRNFENVVIRRSSADLPATVDFELPGSVVRGEVVDERNLHVSGALVNIQSVDEPGKFVQVHAGEDGCFAAYGLARGTHTLQAMSFLKESDSVQVEVGEGDDGPLVRLIVLSSDRLNGRLLTRDGQPVGGARIYAIPFDVPVMMASPATTRPDGTFQLLLAPGARIVDVRVFPPGFAHSAFRRVIGDQPLDLIADDRSGTIVMDFDQGAVLDGLEPYLRHSGAPISPYAMTDWGASFQTVDGKVRIRIPHMEIGNYDACLVRQAELDSFRAGSANKRCTSGYLAPYSELTIHIPSAR